MCKIITRIIIMPCRLGIFSNDFRMQLQLTVKLEIIFEFEVFMYI